MKADVLLTIGDWTIEKLRKSEITTGFKSRRCSYYSLVKHVCYPDDVEKKRKEEKVCVYQVVVYPDEDRVNCWRCAETIPEGIVAVWKFQNWEQLQYGG
jgi:hypothetical protein